MTDLERKTYPYSWVRSYSEGIEGGQYAKANGDGTVTVLELSPTGGGVFVERVIAMEGVELTRVGVQRIG
jgi:hypothetical protein